MEGEFSYRTYKTLAIKSNKLDYNKCKASYKNP